MSLWKQFCAWFGTWWDNGPKEDESKTSPEETVCITKETITSEQIFNLSKEEFRTLLSKERVDSYLQVYNADRLIVYFLKKLVSDTPIEGGVAVDFWFTYTSKLRGWLSRSHAESLFDDQGIIDDYYAIKNNKEIDTVEIVADWVEPRLYNGGGIWKFSFGLRINKETCNRVPKEWPEDADPWLYEFITKLDPENQYCLGFLSDKIGVDRLTEAKDGGLHYLLRFTISGVPLMSSVRPFNNIVSEAFDMYHCRKLPKDGNLKTRGQLLDELKAIGITYTDDYFRPEYCYGELTEYVHPLSSDEAYLNRLRHLLVMQAHEQMGGLINEFTNKRNTVVKAHVLTQAIALLSDIREKRMEQDRVSGLTDEQMSFKWDNIYLKEQK